MDITTVILAKSSMLKLDLYDKNNLQITKDKNLVSNQYTLFGSSCLKAQL